MSILIKGMEMPTYEQGVRTINIYADGVVTNYAEVTIGKAVPVPEHGRLIDADAMCDGLVLNNPVVIYAECMPTIIPADKEGEG